MTTCVLCGKNRNSKAFPQWKVYDTDGIKNGKRKRWCTPCDQELQTGFVMSVDMQLNLRKAEREFIKRNRSIVFSESSISKLRPPKKRKLSQRKTKTDYEQELLQRELAKKSLIEFIKFFNPNYQAGWLHEDICRRLAKFMKAIEAGLSPRLMLFVPPRHGKSTIGSFHFPAWMLGHNPDMEIIAASYGSSLPMSFSRKVRGLLRENRYKMLFPDAKLDRMNENVEGWKTTKGGGYIPAGVGGGITGKGAHCFIVDDPVKDAEEADSETIRQTTWDWWGSTAYTRLAPSAGVLVIQCMTGDTPVLRPDGSETRLDQIQVGDMIATYDNGKLSTAKVLNWASQGRDKCFAITMTTGKIVRANERHPFLVEHDTGKLEWIRLKNLRPTQRIVTLKDNGVNGKAKPVAQKNVVNRSVVAGYVHRTIVKLSGRVGTGLHQLMPKRIAQVISNIDTVLLLKSMTECIKNKKANVLYAKNSLQKLIQESISRFVLTTATIPENFALSSVTSVTLQLDTIEMSKSLLGYLNTTKFTTDEIVSIESVPAEYVYDIQVEKTHNFIANGLISHNTRWHDDDLSGRMIMQMKEELKEAGELREMWIGQGMDQDEVDRKYKQAMLEIDQWEIIEYPAIATSDEYLNMDGTVSEKPKTEKSKFLRLKNEALHPDRFDYTRLMKIKRVIQPRHWSALYQQNPIPEEGMYFTKGMFRFAMPPIFSEMPIVITWDLAIGLKQENDYSVGVVGALDQYDQIHILEMVRGKWDTHDIGKNMLALYVKYKLMTTGNIQLGIESGSIQMSIMPHLRKLMKEQRVFPSFVPEDKMRPINDKLARARPLQGRMQQGKVIFPPVAVSPWVEDIQHELLRFSGGVHDDIVDAMAWMARVFAEISPPKSKKTKKLSSWRDRIAGMTVGSRHPMTS